jgi:cobalt/nickel transport system permease protein
VTSNATVFVTAFLADIVTYVVTALQLALAYPGEEGFLSSMGSFMVIFAITQIPLAIVEGILVVLFFDFLSKRRPELIHESLRVAEAES